MAWNDDLKQAFKETLYGSDAAGNDNEIKASDEPPKNDTDALFEALGKDGVSAASGENVNIPDLLSSLNGGNEMQDISSSTGAETADEDISSFVDAISNFDNSTYTDISSGSAASSFTSSAAPSSPLNNNFSAASNSGFGSSSGAFGASASGGGSSDGSDGFMGNVGFPNTPAKKGIITSGMVIKGSLDSEDMVDMDGVIIGDFTCKSYIAVTGKIKGGVRAEQIVMNGAKVQGNVQAVNGLNVSSETRIQGNVEGRDAIIEGYIKGNVSVVQELTVCSDSVLMGDITASSIEVQRGAVVDGRVSMIGEYSLNRKAALEKLQFEIDA